MRTEEIDFSKVGTSIINREFMEKTRQYYLSKRNYWKQFDQKIGNHLSVKGRLMEMEELSCEFLILPRLLEQFFFLYLNKNQPSQQNKQLALNVTRVFSVLSHQYCKSAMKFNMVASFFVSPSVWDKFLVGRKAKESGLAVLTKIGAIIPPYAFNRNRYSKDSPRFVNMYQFDLDKVDWLYGCVKIMAYLEERTQEEKYQGKKFKYTYDDIVGGDYDFLYDFNADDDEIELLDI